MHVPLGDTYYFQFTTRNFSTGAPFTLAGTPVISVYEENNTTQITAGITLTADYDSVTGLNNVAVVATTGNGYEVGKYYNAVITTGTVNSVSVVGEVVGHFRVMPAEDAGAGIPDVNAVAVSDDTTAADNLELQYDTTGLTGDTFPSTQLQVASLGTGASGALNFAPEADNTGGAIKGVTLVGTNTGTYANLAADDGSVLNMAHATNAIDLVLQFDVGGGRSAASISIKGYLNGSNDEITVQAYNGSTWDTRRTITGVVGTTNQEYIIPLLNTHTGTGADIGKVFIRFVCSAQSAPDLTLDETLVQAVNIGQSVGYANGQISIDTNSSNTNTEAFVDGVADNPVSTIAAANTLNTALDLNQFYVRAGSSITLAASQTEQVFSGEGWTLALGGQDVSNSHFFEAIVSGSGTTASGNPDWHNCDIGTASIGPSDYHGCNFAGTLTVPVDAGDFFFYDCSSGVAGSGSPTMNFSGTGGASTVNVRNWFGGGTWIFDSNITASIEVTKGGGHDITTGGGDVEFRGFCRDVTVTLTGGETVQIIAFTGNITIDGVGTGSTVNIYGQHSGITNTASGSPTVTDESVDGPAVGTNIGVIDGIVDNLNLGIIYGSAATGTLSTTQASTDLTGYADDQLIGRILTWTSGACEGEQTDITDYAQTSGVMTFTALTTAPSNGDTFKVT